MAEADRKDFLISYTGADLAWAKWIAQELERDGYSTIYQDRDFPAGCNFVLQMHEAIKRCDRLIAILSRGYLDAVYTHPEWAAYFKKDPKGDKGLLIPVRVLECDPEGLLDAISYIDLSKLKEGEAAREVLLSNIRKKAPAPTHFPGAQASRPGSSSTRYPGGLPPIWNLPHNQNPNFTGREELLEELHEAVTKKKGAALTQTFAGLGGVGKTQMAVEYAYRFALDYEIVWWLRAEDAATLAGDYAGLAKELDLPEKDAAQQELIVAAVRRRLGQLGKWLLIFDNTVEPKDLKNYLAHGGHIIITSRNQVWGGLGRVVPVSEWKRDESVAFLLKRTGRDEDPSAEDKTAASELGQELGDLPLALEQAAAYMEACGQSISSYLELFRQRHELLSKGEPSQNYPDTVATTWEISFQKVQEESPVAADLLNLCAFLAPDDIPIELLEKGAKHLPERLARAVNDPLDWNEVRAALRRYSLMEMSDDSMSMHRLVQTVVRDRLDEEGKKEWARNAVEMVNEAFPGGNFNVYPEIWPWCARLLPQALAAAFFAEKMQIALVSSSKALNRAGYYLQIRAEYLEAKKAYEQSLAIALVACGPDHAEVANRLNNLGRVLHDLGDLAGAKAHLERALSIGETAYGPNHPKVAIWVNNLGGVLKYLGDLEGAKAHYERALAIWEEALGPTHPNVASAVTNLGGVLRAQGNLAGAMAHYERALAIDEAAYGQNHHAVARDVNNLGNMLKDLGDLAGAKAHFERAFAIDEASYGPNHPNVAIDLNNLGEFLRVLGDLAGAKAHCERALAIFEKALGPSHPMVAIAANNLGLVLLTLGDLEWARAHFERALAIDETAYGPNHPDVAIRVNNLGAVLQDLGDLAGARAHFERALAIFRQFLGEEHPNTKIVKEHLAILRSSKK